MEALLILFYIALFSALIIRFKKFYVAQVPAAVVLAAFLLKVVSGWSFYWLYTNYSFGGDSIQFVENSNYLSALCYTETSAFFKILFGTDNSHEVFMHQENMSLWFSFDPFYNDSQTLIRINALLNFVTAGFYFVNTVWFSFFAVAGLVALLKIFDGIAGSSTICNVVILFLPSCLFWISGVSKESWLIFLLGFFLFSYYRLVTGKFRIAFFLIAVLSGVGLLFIKVYYIIAFLPALIAFGLSIRFKKFNPLYFYAGVYTAGLLILLNFPGIDLLNYISRKQHDFVSYTLFMNSKSIIELPTLEANISSFIKQSPLALWNTLSRPYLWEIKSAFWVVPALENLLIMILIAAGCIGFSYNRKHASFSFACLFFALSILILVGLTTPVIGSLIRYKTPALIFLLAFFLVHLDTSKLKLRLGLIK